MQETVKIDPDLSNIQHTEWAEKERGKPIPSLSRRAGGSGDKQRRPCGKGRLAYGLKEVGGCKVGPRLRKF